MLSPIDLFPRPVVCQRAERLERSADEVWSVVGDIGSEIVGAGMIERVEASGQGAGATRKLILPGGAYVEERIEHHDANDRFYVYRIIDNGVMGFTRYLGMVQVVPAGPGACVLSWVAMAQPVGGTDAELRAALDANIGHVLQAIAGHFAAAPAA